MAFKIVLSFALLAVAFAVPAEYKHEDYEHGPAEYEFSYAVHDDHTGDIKEQRESRKGDVVHGTYSLIDSDGHKRIVEYTADHHNGFNAVVHREPTHIKIPVPAPKAHHYNHAPAPVAHHYKAAPVAHHYHAAPVAHKAPAHYSSKTKHSYEPAHVTFHAPEVNYHY